MRDMLSRRFLGGSFFATFHVWVLGRVSSMVYCVIFWNLGTILKSIFKTIVIVIAVAIVIVIAIVAYISRMM